MTYEQFQEKNKSLFSIILDSETEKLIETVWQSRQIEVDELLSKIELLESLVSEKDSILFWIERKKSPLKMNILNL